MRTVTTISMYVNILVKENKGVYNKKGIKTRVENLCENVKKFTWAMDRGLSKGKYKSC